MAGIVILQLNILYTTVSLYQSYLPEHKVCVPQAYGEGVQLINAIHHEPQNTPRLVRTENEDKQNWTQLCINTGVHVIANSSIFHQEVTHKICYHKMRRSAYTMCPYALIS